MARFQAKAMGYPKLRILLIQHPLGGTPAEEAVAKAVGAVDSVAALFDV